MNNTAGGINGAPVSKVGRYRIEGVLGRGGMGIVYRGVDSDTGEAVAVKTLLTVDDASLGGIRREIRALRRLSHPGIVRIHDDGVDERAPWYAMDLLIGRTLRDEIQFARERLTTAAEQFRAATTATASPHENGAVPPAPVRGASIRRPNGAASSRLLNVLRDVCEALAYLHASGIVHRDLKPDNIFIRDDGSAVLVDLGIAAPFAGEYGREQLDPGAERAGTLVYMAPEQIRGLLVDARTDLYALGCILYECITGEPPFVGATRSAVLNAHLHVRPLAPSELTDDVPAELDRLVLRLLEKRPEDRIGYAEDVISELTTLGLPRLSESAPRRPVGRRPYVYRPPFAGRDDVAAQLLKAVEQIRIAGGIVYVSGESGMGKTRLLMETLRAASGHKLKMVIGQCGGSGSPDEGTVDPPLAAFAPALLAVADHCCRVGELEAARILGPSAKLLSVYQPAITEVPGYSTFAEQPPLQPREARERVLSALVEVLLQFAAVHPLVIVLEDLQWADELSLGALRLLQDHVAGSSGLLALATFRSDQAPDVIGELVAGKGASRVHLSRLGSGDIRILLEGMLALPEAPPDLVSALNEKCGGNPFFLLEYVRGAILAGLLRRDREGRWSLDALADQAEGLATNLPLPPTVSHLLGRRLRSIDGPARRLLHAAAVLGREFDPELLFSSAAVDGTLAARGGSHPAG